MKVEVKFNPTKTCIEGKYVEFHYTFSIGDWIEHPIVVPILRSVVEEVKDINPILNVKLEKITKDIMDVLELYKDPKVKARLDSLFR